jgi:hypothetical protein
MSASRSVWRIRACGTTGAPNFGHSQRFTPSLESTETFLQVAATRMMTRRLAA